MGEIVARNLDDRVIDALAARAARHGRSLEVEVRVILERAAAERIVEIAEAVAWADHIRRDLAGRAPRAEGTRPVEGPRSITVLGPP